MSNAYDRITETILNKLEEGVCPWRRPWNRIAQLPCNFQSRREYSGINLFLLTMIAHERPWFLTFRQVKELGGNVKKGSKGYPIAFWGKHEVEDRDDPNQTKAVPFLKSYTVFNASQVEGIDFPALPQLDQIDFRPLDRAESVIEKWSNKPVVNHGYANACYTPATDTVQMPSPPSFESVESYYATLFHEFGHATGHETRLNRDLSGNFGDTSYGKEELIAEMTSAFLCAHCRIDNSTIDQSAAYLSNWIKAIKQDNKLVVHAAGAARKAAEMVLGVEREARTEPQPQAASVAIAHAGRSR